MRILQLDPFRKSPWKIIAQGDFPKFYKRSIVKKGPGKTPCSTSCIRHGERAARFSYILAQVFDVACRIPFSIIAGSIYTGNKHPPVRQGIRAVDERIPAGIGRWTTHQGEIVACKLN